MKTRNIHHTLFTLWILIPILILPVAVSAAVILTPTQGEILISGSTYKITWAASPADVSCKIDYSIGKHKKWETIVDRYPANESSYDWTVAIPLKNKSKCFLKITTYDANGRKCSINRSGPLSIEVVRLLEPNGQYPLRSESKKTIRWRTHQTQQQVDCVELAYSTNRGKVWNEIAVLDGNPGLYFWFVPEIIRRAARAKVRVTLKDENGNSIGRDQSDTFFKILKPTALKKTIFYNAKILTMEGDEALYGAICIKGNTIKSIGSNEAILAKANRNTNLVNLNGFTIIPGFIDPHTHLLNDAQWQGYSLDGVQWLALTNGVTGIGNIGDLPDQIEHYIEYADQGNMRLRTYHYLCYTDHCGNPCGDWYQNYVPKVEYAPNVWINGIKLFIERSVCPSIKPVFSDMLFGNLTGLGLAEWGDSQLFFTASQLADVIGNADADGYQVAIHAIGDLGVQTTLDAIDTALARSGNINRHMIFHNHFLRDEMVNRYVDSGILPIAEPARPGQAEYYVLYAGENNMKYFKRWKELLDSGAPLAGNSDWPYGSINPIRRIDRFVTNYVPAYPGRVDQPLPALDALKMMTIRSAYAMRCEDKTGSLAPGKLADLVVLSDNPLEIDPANMEDIQVLITMVGGWVEYWSDPAP